MVFWKGKYVKPLSPKGWWDSHLLLGRLGTDMSKSRRSGRSRKVSRKLSWKQSFQENPVFELATVDSFFAEGSAEGFCRSFRGRYSSKVQGFRGRLPRKVLRKVSWKVKKLILSRHIIGIKAKLKPN